MNLLKSIKQAVKNRKIEINLLRHHRPLYRRELDDLRQARESFYDPQRPNAYDLQELYREAVAFDPHLRSLLNTRTHLVLSTDFGISVNDEIIKSDLFQFSWMRKKMKLDMESIFYGYSLCYPVIAGGVIVDIKTIDRGHYVPNKNQLLHNPLLEDGLPLEGLEKYIWVSRLGDHPAGLLETASPLTILKRHSWAAWDEFEQIFGVPLRIAKVRGTDKERQNVLEKMIAMARSSAAAVDYNTDIEVVGNNQSDAHQVFSEKINTVNKELSKLILGQTMTTDDGASRSQSETHYKMQSHIISDDIARLLAHLNAFLPVLRLWGYNIPKEAHVQTVPKPKSAEERIKIDEILLNAGVPLDRDYLEQTYGVKVDVQDTQETTRRKPVANMAAIHDIDHYYNLLN